MIVGYKLLRRRRDGTLGPLFINRRQVIPVGKWLRAESHPTKGYAVRPGWHATAAPVAPHLRTGGDRVWARVELKGVTPFTRPECQGGQWFLARSMRVVEVIDDRLPLTVWCRTCGAYPGEPHSQECRAAGGDR